MTLNLMLTLTPEPVQARERWSMAEAVHIRSGHYWLARTVETAPGSGTCIEKITDRRTSRGSTTFTLRDYAISVEWFHRVDTDAMGLSFSKHASPVSNPNPNEH